MSVIKFKTEWLTQIALLAACGTAEDVADLCTAIQRASLDLPVNEMSPLTETLFHPIAESIEEDRALSEMRKRSGSEGGKQKASKPKQNDSKSVANLSKTVANTEEEREEEKEKKQKKEIVEKEDITDSVDNTCNNIASVLSPSSVCAEPKIDSAPADPPLLTFLLNDGSEFAITQDIYDRLARAYPAVDTMQQLREIESWSFANPKLRKTRNGAMRFVNAWFAKEQDKGLVPKHLTRNKAQPRLTAEEVYNLPAINPWIGEGG